jgi:hypothetical protein
VPCEFILDGWEALKVASVSFGLGVNARWNNVIPLLQAPELGTRPSDSNKT